MSGGNESLQLNAVHRKSKVRLKKKKQNNSEVSNENK